MTTYRYIYNNFTGRFDYTIPLAIGSDIESGTAGSVIYVGASNTLAEYNPGFTFTTDGGLVVTPTGTVSITTNKEIRANEHVVMKEGKKIIFNGG